MLGSTGRSILGFIGSSRDRGNESTMTSCSQSLSACTRTCLCRLFSYFVPFFLPLRYYFTFDILLDHWILFINYFNPSIPLKCLQYFPNFVETYRVTSGDEPRPSPGELNFPSTSPASHCLIPYPVLGFSY